MENGGYGNGAMYMKILSQGSSNYPHLTPLTPEQIKEAEVLKEQWVNTHPPLTNYYSKLLIVGDMFSY